MSAPRGQRYQVVRKHGDRLRGNRSNPEPLAVDDWDEMARSATQFWPTDRSMNTSSSPVIVIEADRFDKLREDVRRTSMQSFNLSGTAAADAPRMSLQSVVRGTSAST